MAAGAPDIAALRACTLWLLVASINCDEDRVAAEALKIVKYGHDVTLFTLGALTFRASTALIREHGSREAAIEAITTQLVDAEMTAAEGDDE